MASFLARTLSSSRLIGTVLLNVDKQLINIGTRTLFSHEILGLDGYQRHRALVDDRLRELKARFSERMDEYMKQDDNNTIFTDDLKNMVAIVETDPDLEVAEKMLRRYYKQSNDSILRQFTFGPVIMRMLHANNKVDLALKLYKDADLDGFFNQVSTTIVLADMLYEHERYQDAIDVYNLHMAGKLKKSAEGDSFGVYSNDLCTLAYACYYKQNTPESLGEAKTLFTQMIERGANISNRSASFLSLLSLNQGEQEFSYEVLTNIRSQRLNTVKNLRIISLAKMGRIEESLMIMRSVLHNDDGQRRMNEIFQETVEELERAIDLSGRLDMKQQYDVIKQNLINNGCVTQMLLSAYICQPIIRTRGPSTSFKSRDRPEYFQDSYRQGDSYRQDNRRDSYRQDDRRDSYRQDDSYGQGDRDRYDDDSRAFRQGQRDRYDDDPRTFRQGIRGYDR